MFSIRMLMIPILLLAGAVDLLSAESRKAAIFVVNRAERSMDEKLAAFEDFISSRLADKGFSVITREAVTDAVSSLTKDSKQTELDQMLANNSSMLRLGRLLGADYIVVASISSFGMDKQTLPALKVVNVIYNLRVSYKVLEGVQGSTIAGSTFRLRHAEQYTDSNRIESTDVVNDLLDKASGTIAANMSKKSIAIAAAASKLVELAIACGMQDLGELPVSVPDIRLTPDNTVVIEKNKLEVQVLDVTVELDGVVTGSAPSIFKIAPGLHKLRLTREGFKTWERTINITEGQRLKVALQMSDAGYQRWRDNTAFLFSIETGRKLTDAEVKRLEGEAQMLRQSGNKVDVKKDIKVDTRDGLKIYKSIY